MEVELSDRDDELAEAKGEIKELHSKVENPEPAINFGSPGEEWSFEVFDFCATILVERPTCHAAANIL